MSVSLIIPAAGVGKRFLSNVKKQFIEIDNKPLIYWTLNRLLSAYNFNEIIIGINNDDIPFVEDVIHDSKITIPCIYAEGGKERANTVFNCISKSTCKFVAIHDSVRPFVTNKVIVDTINRAIQNNVAAICGLYVRDTIKKVENNIITTTISRDNLFLAHTPQVFNKDIIYTALNKVLNDDILITDEASACEYAGISVDIVLSNYENIKITFTEDIDLIKLFKKKFFEV